MRNIFRPFAFLDLISLCFIAMQLWNISLHFDEMSNQPSAKIQSILMFPMFALLLIGAIGLFLNRKFGIILYYIQFPFRLYLWIFSVGFITLLPEALNSFDERWFPALLKVCFMVEFIRLYLTIKGHLKMKNRY